MNNKVTQSAMEFLVFEATLPNEYLKIARTQALANGYNGEIDNWLLTQEADARECREENDVEDIDANMLRAEVRRLIGTKTTEQLRRFALDWSDSEAASTVSGHRTSTGRTGGSMASRS